MLRPFLIITFLIGLGLLIYASSIPYYNNIKTKYALDDKAGNVKSIDAQFKRYYYSELAKIETNRRFLEDLGSGLIISTLILLLTVLIFKIKFFKDFIKLKSLSKTAIWVISIAMWFALFPATIWYYGFRAGRGDYPWFADTIAIPIFETGISLIIGLIPLCLFLYVCTIGYTQPINLFIRYQSYTLKRVMIEVFWFALILLNILILIELLVDGDHVSIPVNFYFIYLIILLRAGNIPSLNSYENWAS